MAIGTALYPALQSQPPAKARPSAEKLLIVGEDEPGRRLLHTSLYSLGFNIGEAVSGEEALALCRILHFDAVLLDVHMCGNGAIKICAELRRLLPRGAILVLGVNGDQERKIQALEAGADDYLTGPLNLRELTARIRATLRRTVTTPAPTEDVVVIGELSVDRGRRLVEKAGRRIHLTPKEFELVNCLITPPDVPVTHRRLLRVLWTDENATRVDCLRNLVRQLRKKIEDDPGAPRYVLTESHIGYRFAGPSAVSGGGRG